MSDGGLTAVDAPAGLRMNPVWFAHNLATSWRHRRSLRDFGVRMAWIYAIRLGLVGREWTIGFRYPPPVGDIRLLVRAN
jgi:hypothetical protein